LRLRECAYECRTLSLIEFSFSASFAGAVLVERDASCDTSKPGREVFDEPSASHFKSERKEDGLCGILGVGVVFDDAKARGDDRGSMKPYDLLEGLFTASLREIRKQTRPGERRRGGGDASCGN